MNEELTEYLDKLRRSSKNALAKVLYNLWWVDWSLESYEPQKEWGTEEWKKYARFLEAEGQKLFWETVKFHKEKTDAQNKLRRGKNRPKRKIPGAKAGRKRDENLKTREVAEYILTCAEYEGIPCTKVFEREVEGLPWRDKQFFISKKRTILNQISLHKKSR